MKLSVIFTTMISLAAANLQLEEMLDQADAIAETDMLLYAVLYNILEQIESYKGVESVTYSRTYGPRQAKNM